MRRLVLPVAGLCGLALAVVPALASDKQINASGTSWSPDDVTVNPGDKVTISNPNGGNHDLYWKDGAPGHPGPAPNIGDTSTWSSVRTFSDADVGKTFRFYCSVHSDDQGVGMDGIVRVVAAGSSGTTTTTNPPPGGTTTTSTTPPPPPPPGGTTTTSTTPPPPSGGDTTAPRATRARSSASRRGVTVRLTLSEAATVTLRVFRGPRRIARRVFDVQSGAVKLRIRRALRRGRYRLRLTLVDDAGNRSSKSLRARVK